MDGPINCTTCDMLILMGQFEGKMRVQITACFNIHTFSLYSICSQSVLITRVKSLKQIRKPLTLLRDKRDPLVGQPVFF